MENLDKILDKALQYLDKSEAFLGEQIPEFCRQLMEYSAWSVQWHYDISFYFALFFFVFSVILFITGMLKEYNAGETYFAGGVTGLVFIISFCCACGAYSDLKMYKIAPKVFLIKTVKEMTISRDK